MATAIESFSEYLFWDVNRDDVDPEKNAPFLVQRVLEYGQLSDWDLLNALYGLDKITEITKNLRSLDPRALSFISVISSIPKEQFRCYTTRQSSRKHWIY